MERDLHSCPSFLKLLMEEDFTKKIRIPNAFTMNFKNKLSRNCVLKVKTVKKSWLVRICCKDNNFYICKDSWPDFVKDHKLKYGDYLLFWLVKKATFMVMHYGADCNLKLEVSGESDSSSSSDEGFDSMEEDDSNEEDEEDGDEEDEDDDLIPPAKNTNNKQNRVLSVGCSNENQKSRQVIRNSGVRVKEENEMGREEPLYTRDCHYETNLKNPYFVKQLPISSNKQLTIPSGFMKETKLDFKEKFFLHGEDDREWSVKIWTRRGERFLFTQGWSSFWKGYQLKGGETCKFTLLRSLGNVFSIEIKRPE